MNIIGEMQDSEKFVPMVIKKILNNEVVTIHGSADKKIVGSRFYLHARNQADALLHVSKMDPVFFGDSDKPLRFNIAGQKEVSNLEMAQMIAKYMNRELDLNYEIVDFHSSRPGHDLRYALDSSKLYESGWEPKLSLEESLKKTVEWTINHQEWLF
jgi:dTDP-glucose 4,6-dehydratase